MIKVYYHPELKYHNFEYIVKPEYRDTSPYAKFHRENTARHGHPKCFKVTTFNNADLIPLLNEHRPYMAECLIYTSFIPEESNTLQFNAARFEITDSEIIHNMNIYNRPDRVRKEVESFMIPYLWSEVGKIISERYNTSIAYYYNLYFNLHRKISLNFTATFQINESHDYCEWIKDDMGTALNGDFFNSHPQMFSYTFKSNILSNYQRKWLSLND